MTGVLLWLVFIAQSAVAANFTAERKLETHKVKLEELAVLQEPRLDWRNPAYEVTFEIPSNDWIENLDFYVKLHAEGKVSDSAPIYIRLNDGAPVPVRAEGHSFEAKVSLDTSSVRAYRNKISISFEKNLGCIEAHDGAYSIDMDDSFIVLKASSPSRVYYLKEAKQILASPLTTPKTISISAFGPKKLTHEALACLLYTSPSPRD